MIGLDEAHEEFRRLSKLLDDGLRYAGDQVKAYADAEMTYRRAKSAAYVQVPDTIKLADEKKAWVEAASAEERRVRDLADGMRRVGLEAIRSRQTQISALQTLSNLAKAEANFARTGP